MSITVVDDLSDYEVEEVFHPYMFTDDDHYPTVERLGMIDDPEGLFEYVTLDREYVMVFESAGHERDSSNDTYTLYKRKHGC